MWYKRGSILVKSVLREAEEGDEHRGYVEKLADDSADGGIEYIVHYPQRRDHEKLSPADHPAVTGPHSKRAAALSNKEYERYPPHLAEKDDRGDTGCGKADLDENEISRPLASVSEGKYHTAQNAEKIDKHSCPRGEQSKLKSKGDGASHLHKKITPVPFTLIGDQRASRANVADKLNRVKNTL